MAVLPPCHRQHRLRLPAPPPFPTPLLPTNLCSSARPTAIVHEGITPITRAPCSPLFPSPLPRCITVTHTRDGRLSPFRFVLLLTSFTFSLPIPLCIFFSLLVCRHIISESPSVAPTFRCMNPFHLPPRRPFQHKHTCSSTGIDTPLYTRTHSQNLSLSPCSFLFTSGHR